MAIFKEHADYLYFLEQVRMVKEVHPFKIHSLCLMSNHFHMSLETMDTELWKIMQKVLHPYSMDFNHKYGYTGHVFESRYVSCCIKDDVYLLEASRYIHLNPVKAMMVRGPLDYEYSSYGAFFDDSNADDRAGITVKPETIIKDLVDTSRVLGGFHNNSREQYRMFVEGKISHAEQEMLIQKDMKEDDMWLPW